MGDQSQNPTPGIIAERFKQWTDQRRGVSPLYEAIVGELIVDNELLTLIAEAGNREYICNRFMAAVHYMLLEGESHSLADYYGTVTRRPGPVTDAYSHFREFCLKHKHDLLQLTATREIQINEVRRCVALLPAFAWARQLEGNRPLALLDVGAAAGLNLLLDHFYYDYGASGTVGNPMATVKLVCELRGLCPPVLPKEVPPIAWRRGIDCQPVRATDVQATNWMIALVSPDDLRRLGVLQAALNVAHQSPPEIVQGNACDVLLSAVAESPQDASLCVFHCFTTHHFSKSELKRFDDVLSELGKLRDFVLISMEWETNNGKTQTHEPIPIIATSFVHGQRDKQLLGRVDNRGGCDWLEWLHPDSALGA